MNTEEMKKITKRLPTTVLKKWLADAEHEVFNPIPLSNRSHLLESITLMREELEKRSK